VLGELESGRGLVLLRGFPVDRWAAEDLRDIYWGLGSHLGHIRYQNARGELIGEVRDEIARYGEVREGPAVDAVLGRSSRSKARSSGPLRFHTDRCDIVSLLVVRTARSGGLSKVVSAVSVAEAIRARRPDLHALLYQDYWRSRHVEAAQKLPGVPKMSAAQDEALDLHAAVCEELAFAMAFQPGDLQLLNNHVIYHARTAYEDTPGVDNDRMLLRLWLAPRNSRALPPGFEVLWGTTAPGAPRGGITQTSD
jgi:hypothetical protein